MRYLSLCDAAFARVVAVPVSLTQARYRRDGASLMIDDGIVVPRREPDHGTTSLPIFDSYFGWSYSEDWPRERSLLQVIGQPVAGLSHRE